MTSKKLSPLSVLLIVGATLRITRFITTDFLGEWTIVGPAKRWAAVHEWRELTMAPALAQPDPDVLAEIIDDAGESTGGPVTVPAKMVSGLDCGYCLSPWIVGGLLIVTAIVGRIPIVGTMWKWFLSTLSLSYLVGHVWNRADNI